MGELHQASAGTCDKAPPAPCGAKLAGPAGTAASDAARAAARAAAAAARVGMPRMIQRLRTLCAIDSGSDAPWGRERVAGYLAAWAEEAGCDVERVPTESGTSLIIGLGHSGGRPEAPLIALVGHHDTVFPRGTALRCGFRERDGKAFGPGTADMKGGLLVALEAMAALAGLDLPPVRVELHSVPDEEQRIGGAFATAGRVKGARAALVLECARENGDLVVARKSQAHLSMRAEGHSAHSGTEPERGRSALIALAREALRVDALTGAVPGLTVTVGTLLAGTSFNTVAGRGEAGIDVRASRAADLDWAIDQISRTVSHDGVDIDLRTVSRWPALEETEQACVLFGLARSVGFDLGLNLGACRTGGASDGCWTSAAGVPTLDGLGPVGGLDHSPHEYIETESFPERCGLLAGLIVAIATHPFDERRCTEPRAGASAGADLPARSATPGH